MRNRKGKHQIFKLRIRNFPEKLSETACSSRFDRLIMDPKSWNEDYAEKILKSPQTPELSSAKRMMDVPCESDTKQQPPRKMPRNLGLQAWEKFHAAATPAEPSASESDAEVSAKAETSLSVIVGVEAESVRVQDDCGKLFSYSRYV